MGSGSSKQIERSSSTQVKRNEMENKQTSDQSNLEDQTLPDKKNRPGVEEKSEFEPFKKNSEDQLSYLEQFSLTVEECCSYFSKEPATMEWAVEEGKELGNKIRKQCCYFRKSSLKKEERKKLADLCLSSTLNETFFKFLSYAFTSLPEVLEKDENVLRNDFELADNPEEKIRYSQILQAQNIISSMVAYFVNNTDSSEEFCTKCVELGVVDLMLKYLQKYQTVLDEKDKESVTYVQLRKNRRMMTLSRVLSFHNNLANCQQRYMVEKNAIDIVMYFVKCSNDLVAMKSLLVLSYLIGEKENHLICTSLGPVKLYIKHLQEASKSKEKTFNGFGLVELLRGLAMIAQNDKNKKLIGEKGGIDVIEHVIETLNECESDEDIEIIENALHCLYLLSFNEENMEIILKDLVVTEALKSYKTSTNKTIRKYAMGTLWELKGKKSHEMRMKKNKSRRSKNNCEKVKEEDDEKVDENKTESSEEAPIEAKLNHITISYQWSHQPIMLKVRDKLQASGYTVWIDLDEMQGSTLEAMANAVENAFLILMSISPQYKASANCRSEAEYAFQLKKPMIPLMMEKDYQPDGWLGFMVGSKLWIDFTLSDRKNIDKSLENLVNEISRQGFVPGQEISVKQSSTEKTNPISTEKRLEISKWTQGDLLSWLKSIGLADKFSNDVIDKHLDGDVLLHLLDLKKESPDIFYRLLRKELAIDSLKVLFKFAGHLEKLGKS